MCKRLAACVNMRLSRFDTSECVNQAFIDPHALIEVELC